MPAPHGYNRRVHSKPRLCLLTGWLLLGLLASGCSPASSASPPPATAPLVAYATASPTLPPPSATPAADPATAIPEPTPTPFVYTVRAGDTLLGIALQFGITLDALQAANPSVDPRFLSVGVPLVIPLEGAVPDTPADAPPPATLELSAPACSPAANGSLWCLTAATNPNAEALENIEVRITLLAENGNALAVETAIVPLNLLPAGERLVLAAFFAAPPPAWASARAETRAALLISEPNDRYLPIQIEAYTVALHSGGRAATVQGTLRLPPESENASLVWLALMAWDAEGNPLGVRRWENPAGLAAGGTLAFEFEVYSLSSAIASVTLLAEARP